MSESHLQPPEYPDREPLRHDPVPIETVYDWRDKIENLTLQCGYGTGKGGSALAAILKHMNETLDDCHGFNDEQPSEEDMKSAHDDQQYHWAKDEGLLP